MNRISIISRLILDLMGELYVGRWFHIYHQPDWAKHCAQSLKALCN